MTNIIYNRGKKTVQTRSDKLDRVERYLFKHVPKSSKKLRSHCKFFGKLVSKEEMESLLAELESTRRIAVVGKDQYGQPKYDITEDRRQYLIKSRLD